MKINSLVETTTSGSVAPVATPMGGMHKRAGSMFKGKKTSKPFYEEKKEGCSCGCEPSKCSCDDNITESRVKQLEMDLKEMSDEKFYDKYKKTKAQMRSSLREGAMPASVIKTKENIRMASDEENKKRFAGKTKEELASMARRHGYKDKNPYAKFHDGKTGTNESKILKGMLEADLHEDDLILMPGQGARFKRELMPKRTDHEVEMARGQLYQSAKNAKDICHMLEGISEMQGIDAWVQSKITTAADYLETVRAYLESKYEMQHEVDEATAHEKFKKSVKKRGYDMDAGADRLEALLAKQAKERAEFEKKYASAYGHEDKKEVDEEFDLSGVWDTVKSGASKAADYISNIGYGSAEEYGRELLKAQGKSEDDISAIYSKQLAQKNNQNKTNFPRATNDRQNDLGSTKPYKPYPVKVSVSDRDQTGLKPYPADARPMPTNEEELNEIGWSSAADYGKDFAAANKYVPPAQKQAAPAAPAGPSLWDRAKNVAASLRPFDEKTAASNFGYKPQQVAQARTAPQTPMYEGNGSVSPVAGAITHRILNQHPEILKYGPESVIAAIDDVADWIGDVDEIGSSDVSGWVQQVIRMLEENPPEAFVKESEKPGLWANIHAKQNRIKNGSGERMRKPGSKGAPTKDAFIQSARKK
jgi:hypothetical protein